MQIFYCSETCQMEEFCFRDVKLLAVWQECQRVTANKFNDFQNLWDHMFSNFFFRNCKLKISICTCLYDVIFG
jgi:hypothetical protein